MRINKLYLAIVLILILILVSAFLTRGLDAYLISGGIFISIVLGVIFLNILIRFLD
jgi:hypothetical protein